MRSFSTPLHSPATPPTRSKSSSAHPRKARRHNASSTCRTRTRNHVACSRSESSTIAGASTLSASMSVTAPSSMVSPSPATPRISIRSIAGTPSPLPTTAKPSADTSTATCKVRSTSPWRRSHPAQRRSAHASTSATSSPATSTPHASHPAVLPPPDFLKVPPSATH